MPLPAIGPLTDQKIPGVPDGLDADEADRLARIVGAVNGFVRGLPIAGRAYAATDTQEAADALVWPDRIVEGAVMLAARLWRRKDTPGGVSTLGDGGVVYVRRNDPDVALLLEIGEHGKPGVG